ncbi:MAG: endo alpha-1,4 polygalactosaminidase, partial [Pseudomonas sp. PGPPP3]
MKSLNVLFAPLIALLLSSSACAETAPTWWQPTPGTSWQIQLQGNINTSYAVQMYVIDLFDAPQTVIDNLHGRGIKVICYFRAG